MTALQDATVGTPAPAPLRAYRPGTAPAGLVPQQRTTAGAAASEATQAPVPAGPVAVPQADDVEALWARYEQERCSRAREQLILNYVPLVTAVAGRLGMRLPSSVEHADLVSYGMFGLIDAIEKYRTERAVKFESYASSRIRGAIIDELRAMDWVPRSVRTKARAVDRAYGELEATLHRAPTEAEVAQRLDLPVNELRAVYTQLAAVNIAALDELLAGSDDRPGAGTLADTLGDRRAEDPAGSVEAQETKYLLARAIECLGERERLVVVLYYYESMTLAEIGRVLGVTESRISQIHTAAMVRLRTRLLDAERA
ncbi:FliA/WhiG family RNA polymerase sigma factor [Cellulomonas sp.]|uniref:FliA/WhiG family RNA polymerase sigma factor n=1 Tax=Cellulomonas sp. TaxID=40001 RepID=UPI0028118BE7|nr:FliA/WhiG family RNA polymerase sigma factor [Cellulomonas sp.]